MQALNIYRFVEQLICTFKALQQAVQHHFDNAAGMCVSRIMLHWPFTNVNNYKTACSLKMPIDLTANTYASPKSTAMQVSHVVTKVHHWICREILLKVNTCNCKQDSSHAAVIGHNESEVFMKHPFKATGPSYCIRRTTRVHKIQFRRMLLLNYVDQQSKVGRHLKTAFLMSPPTATAVAIVWCRHGRLNSGGGS